ncbi:MAG: TldD/PmbA family protein, partial [Planctomycetes bacterium]|nr:TldD/PmbA family protein [Planctomycetota bacterium]
MIEQDESRRTAQALLGKIKADEAEVVITSDRTGATRFSRNSISQNVDESMRRVRIRVIKDGRQGVATVNSFDDAMLSRAVERALAAAAHSQPDPDILPMIDRQPEYQNVDTFNAETFEATPRMRAERILEQVNLCRQRDLEAAGLLQTGGGSCAYANSKGVFAYCKASIASLTFSAFADDGSVEGAADAVDHNINSLSTRKVGNTAVERAIKARKPKVVPAGEYDVVLERGAVSDLILFLSWLGLSAQRHVEGRSPLAGRIGEKLFSDKLTMISDPYDPRFEGRPFDMEGYPTKKVVMIEKGVFKALPHDRRTAKALGGENSGYGNLQPDIDGPEPGSVTVKEGDATIESMIRSTKRGLLVNQFHYSNTVDPMALSVTGMTRGGLWMIENGEIAYAVKNLRYTENLFKALSNIEAVGNIAEPGAGNLFGGGAVLPA